MKEEKYSNLCDIVEGKVKRISFKGNFANPGLNIEIENTQKDSPIKKLKYFNHEAPVSIRYGDFIRAYYLKADEVIKKRKGPMIISSFYIHREAKEEEIVEMIEILNEKEVVATYGYISDEKVKVSSDHAN